MAINSRGDIVGFSDLTGDENGANPNFRAFLWIRPGPMQDLQTLSGDVLSEALGITTSARSSAPRSMLTVMSVPSFGKTAR